MNSADSITSLKALLISSWIALYCATRSTKGTIQAILLAQGVAARLNMTAKRMDTPMRVTLFGDAASRLHSCGQRLPHFVIE
jgi:hypothetical protein